MCECVPVEAANRRIALRPPTLLRHHASCAAVFLSSAALDAVVAASSLASAFAALIPTSTSTTTTATLTRWHLWFWPLRPTARAVTQSWPRHVHATAADARRMTRPRRWRWWSPARETKNARNAREYFKRVFQESI